LSGSYREASSWTNDSGTLAKSLVPFLVISQEVIYTIIDPSRITETTGMPFCFLDLLLILVKRDLRFFAKLRDIYRNLIRFSSTKILLVNLT
jgi:hypothetical protein